MVLVTEGATPPVCKLIDYGQFMYQQKKKDKQAKKGIRGQVVKELKMSPKISIHDYKVRVNRATEFLKKGYKVKLWISFRGREMMYSEFGTELIQRFLEDVKEVGVPDQGVQRTQRTMIVIILPK